MEVYKLAHELEVSSIQIIEAMKELSIPVQLPNPSMSTDDAQKIREKIKKSSGFLSSDGHNGSLFSNERLQSSSNILLNKLIQGLLT